MTKIVLDQVFALLVQTLATLELAELLWPLRGLLVEVLRLLCLLGLVVPLV